MTEKKSLESVLAGAIIGTVALMDGYCFISGMNDEERSQGRYVSYAILIDFSAVGALLYLRKLPPRTDRNTRQ